MWAWPQACGLPNLSMVGLRRVLAVALNPNPNPSKPSPSPRSPPSTLSGLSQLLHGEFWILNIVTQEQRALSDDPSDDPKMLH